MRFNPPLSHESPFSVCVCDWLSITHKDTHIQAHWTCSFFSSLIAFSSSKFPLEWTGVVMMAMKQRLLVLQHRWKAASTSKKNRKPYTLMRPYAINSAWDNKWVMSSKPGTKWNSSVPIVAFYLDFKALSENSSAVNVTIKRDKRKRNAASVSDTTVEWIFDDI